MIHPTRVRPLNDLPVRPDRAYVLYWMQQAARTRYNHALAAATAEADRLGKPLVVCFGLMDDYPEANARHYAHLLEGLRDVRAALEAMGVAFVVRHGPPFAAAVALGARACAVFCDRGYLRHQKLWRDKVAAGVDCQVIEVESDVVVPVDVASDKQEYAARTLRPKIHRHLATYLVPLKAAKPEHGSLSLKLRGDIDVSDPAAALAKLKVDRGVAPVTTYPGGEVAAHARLDAFLADGLAGYAEGRNEPADARTSHLSMSLHFGHISALEVALRVRDAEVGSAADRDAYLEELIVRRELSANYCHRSPDYDAYAGLPAWARQTLDAHRDDARVRLFTRDQLEAGETDDVYWNAAQMEMVLTGFMVNYMRMYWGKRVLGWMPTPEESFATTLAINNKFFLCGRDPNAYASVAWVFGLHDRPWGPRREVFGTVRYMNAGGLERKFDIDRYVARVDELCVKETGKSLSGTTTYR